MLKQDIDTLLSWVEIWQMQFTNNKCSILQLSKQSQKFISILYIREAPQDCRATLFRNSNRPPPLLEFTSYLCMQQGNETDRLSAA